MGVVPAQELPPCLHYTPNAYTVRDMNEDTRSLATAWGREIKTRRKALKLDQTELAEHLGVSQATVSRWESGAMLPGAVMQARLVSRLGIDPVQLHRLVTSAVPA